MQNSSKWISIALLFSTLVISNHLIAAPFDKTGIIDLKNEGTTRMSCVAVGAHLRLATNRIASQIMDTPAQGQDGQWKKQKAIEEIRNFGEAGHFGSQRLKVDISKHVPPSQMNDYLSGYGPASQRINQAMLQDPWIVVKAWEYCGKAYDF